MKDNKKYIGIIKKDGHRCSILGPHGTRCREMVNGTFAETHDGMTMTGIGRCSICGYKTKVDKKAEQ